MITVERVHLNQPPRPMAAVVSTALRARVMLRAILNTPHPALRVAKAALLWATVGFALLAVQQHDGVLNVLARRVARRRPASGRADRQTVQRGLLRQLKNNQDQNGHLTEMKARN
ncbi:MAG: hypothetical protein M5R40_07065 [Anaerolineae bacterium]|nr:hypothetical protein [Anaerolineae bacterium]